MAFLYEIGTYVWLDVGAYDAPPELTGAVIGARILDRAISHHDGKRVDTYLVGTLAKQFPPRWVRAGALQGRMPDVYDEPELRVSHAIH